MKKTLLVVSTLSVMLLSGCSLLGGVSKADYEAVIADRDYYMEEYNNAVEEQAELETEKSDLETQIAELEEENTELLDQILAMEESSNTVEAYYTQPAVKQSLDAQIEAMKDSYSGVYSDLGYEVSGNTFTYWFRFATQIPDAEAAAEQLEASITEDMLAGIVSDVEDECGVYGITCNYIYYNADGSIIYQNSYSTEWQ